MHATRTATLTLVYLARLREAFGRGSESWPLDTESASVGAIVDALRARDGVWAHELDDGRAVRVAVNQVMATRATIVHAGDEVALFPPVTGG